MTAWAASSDPLLVLVVVVVGGLYADGVLRLRRRGSGVVRRRHVAAFGAGLCLLMVALSAPVEDAGGRLLSAHMTQHLLLTLGAAPLVAAGRPELVLPGALPVAGRRRWQAARRLPRRVWRRPVPPVAVAAGLHIAVLWLWHVPTAYEAALGSGLVHRLEHASFTGTALALWLAILAPNRRTRLRHGIAVLSVAAVLIAGGILGALLTFAAVPLYDHYAAAAGGEGLSPLADQQLAGVLLWVPPGFFYGVTAAVLFRRWYALLEELAPAPASQRSPGSAVSGGMRTTTTSTPTATARCRR